jgi:hypothetical protein
MMRLLLVAAMILSVNADATSQALTQMTYQYYNALTAALSGNIDGFQVFMTPPVIATNDKAGESLFWQLLNDVPAFDITTNQPFAGNNSNNFAQLYGSLLGALKLPATDGAEQILGPDYPQWYQCWIDAPVTSDPYTVCVGCSRPFPDKYNQMQNWCYTTFKNNLATVARTKYDDPKCVKHNDYAYTPSLKTLLATLPSGAALTAHMDSATSSSDVSSTWSGGGNDGAFSFFDSSSSSSDSLTKKFENSHITMDIKMEKVIQIPVYAGCWFYQPALTSCAANPSLMDPNIPPSYNQLFGSSGTLRRYVTQIYAVDGYSISVLSDVTLSSSEQTETTSRSRKGFWPFYTTGSSSSSKTETHFNDAGNANITISAPADGKPRIIGRTVGLVQTASSFMSAAHVSDSDSLRSIADSTNSDILKHGIFQLLQDYNDKTDFIASAKSGSKRRAKPCSGYGC